MSTSYTGLGTTINVRAAGTNASVGFNTDVAIVGGYDVDDATVDAGEVEVIENNAGDLFGADSELATQAQLSKINGAGNIYGIAVPESSGTTEFTDASDGTLDDAPVFDPRLHDDHEIVVSDDAGDEVEVEISDAEEPSAPTDGAAVNPNSGAITFDSVGTYTVEYDKGEYEDAIADAAALNVRKVIVCTEATSVKNTLLGYLEDEATDIRMKRGVVGATPGISATEVADYEPDIDHQRIIESAPARGDTGDGVTRTVGALGGAYSAQPLGESLTYDAINGFESFAESYRPSQARDFERVTAIADTFEVAEGVTTSSEEAFRDVYAVEIIDTVAQGLYLIAKEYAGGPNTQDDQDNLESDGRNLLSGYANQRPPLLSSPDGSNPYSVEVNQGSADDEVVMNVGVDPLDVMKNVIVNLNVGTVVTYEGASVAN